MIQEIVNNPIPFAHAVGYTKLSEGLHGEWHILAVLFGDAGARLATAEELTWDFGDPEPHRLVIQWVTVGFGMESALQLINPNPIEAAATVMFYDIRLHELVRVRHDWILPYSGLAGYVEDLLGEPEFNGFILVESNVPLVGGMLMGPLEGDGVYDDNYYVAGR